jgi:hypothetical protein
MKMLTCKNGYRVPDYSQPGVREQVERECQLAEMLADPPRNSLELRYLLWRTNNAVH